MTLGEAVLRCGDYNYDQGRWEGETGGGSGRTYGKGRRGRRWHGDWERCTGRGDIRSVRELTPEREMY